MQLIKWEVKEIQKMLEGAGHKNSAGVKSHDSTDKTNPCFFNYS